MTDPTTPRSAVAGAPEVVADALAKSDFGQYAQPQDDETYHAHARLLLAALASAGYEVRAIPAAVALVAADSYTTNHRVSGIVHEPPLAGAPTTDNLTIGEDGRYHCRGCDAHDL